MLHHLYFVIVQRPPGRGVAGGFAFDARRQAVVLAAADKSGGSQKRFYRTLIATADARLDANLAQRRKGL